MPYGMPFHEARQLLNTIEIDVRMIWFTSQLLVHIFELNTKMVNKKLHCSYFHLVNARYFIFFKRLLATR